LPLRIAGRHAPEPPLSRRPAREPAASGEVEYHVGFVPEVVQDDEEDAVEDETEAETEAEAPTAVPVHPARPRPTVEVSRRTALAEFTALATSNGDDFSFRRR